MDYSVLPLLKKNDLQDDSFLRKKYSAGDLRLIGRGSFGKVILAERIYGNEKIKVAVKVIETNDEHDFDESMKELKNLSLLKGHENIMSYSDYQSNIVDIDKIYQLLIEMPLATNSLENILKNSRDLSEDVVKDILIQLAFGLSFAHEKKLAHLDLKPDNILLIGDTYMIADWGGSLKLRSSASTVLKSGFCMTPGYNAPEINEDNSDNTKKCNYFLCDIYSLGIVTLRLCGISYSTINSIPKDKKLKELHDTALKEIGQDVEKKYSNKLLDLILRMTKYKPKKRISLAELIELLG